jgi:hypothetical protein
MKSHQPAPFHYKPGVFNEGPQEDFFLFPLQPELEG